MADIKAIRIILLSTILAAPALALAASNPGIQQSRIIERTNLPQDRVDAPDLYREGIDALLAHRFSEAREIFARILARSPKEAGAYYLAGVAHAGLDDPEGARLLYAQAVRFDGKLIFARRELALAHVRLGDRSKAETELAALTTYQARCRGKCGKAAQIDAAVETVRAALASESPAPAEAGPLLARESRPWIESGRSPAS